MKKIILLVIYCFSIAKNWGQSPKLIIPQGHFGNINNIALSPDETKLATVSGGDPSLKIWDTRTGKLLATLTTHTADINMVVFSNKGDIVASAGNDKKVFLYNAKNGVPYRQTLSAEDQIHRISFSYDDKYLLVSSDITNSIKVFDMEDFLLNSSLSVGGTVTSSCFSYDSKLIAIGTQSRELIIWDPIKDKEIKHVRLNNVPLSVSFSKDNASILVADYKGEINCFDIKTGTKNFSIQSHTKATKAFYSKSFTKMISYSDDGTAKIWNSKDQKLVASISINSEITQVELSDNENILATFCKDSVFYLWDANTGKLINKLSKHWNIVCGGVFTRDSKKIYSFSDDCTVIQWDIKKAKPILHFKGATNLVNFPTTTHTGKELFLTTGDKSAKIWNLNTVELSNSLQGHNNHIIVADISNDLSKAVTASLDNEIKIWNLKNKQCLATYKKHNSYATSIKLLKNGDRALSLSSNNELKIWETKTGKSLAEIKPKKQDIEVVVSPNEKTCFYYSKGGNEAILFSLDSMKPIKSYNDSLGSVRCAEYSSDGKLLSILSNMGRTLLINLNTLKTVQTFIGSYVSVGQVVTFSPNLNMVLSFGRETTVFDINTGSKILTHLTNLAFPDIALFTPDSKKIIVSNGNRKLHVVDISTSKLLYSINAENNIAFSKAWFIPKTDTLIILMNNGSYTMWSIGNKSKQLCTMFSIGDENDYIVTIPSGYYKSTTDGSKQLHYVTKDLKVITFEQLDVKYNRPDKVLEAIGNTDTLLINSYRKAYQKRIKKLGIDTTQFADGYSVPEADFVNRDNIDYEQSKSKISLTIKANDSIYKLDRFNVWVNEVPIFGLRGIRVKRKNNFDTTIAITLSQGENRIETSVTNINGTESYKMPLFVKYIASKSQPSKQYFIGIGINQFANSDYNLNWSVKDIRDLAIKFKSKYPNIMIDTLFDKNVTKENILALKKKLLQLSEDDKVIVSYSGHGVLSKEFDYFLSTYSIDFTKPEENGLAYDDLESLLDNIKPRQKLLLIDACHSGEVDKDELLKIETAKTELNKNGVATKSTIKVVKKEKQLGLANSFELMQNLFVNVGKGTGATIISAAGGTQYAQERGDLKNGVFTYSIIEAMNSNKTLSVSQLKKLVGERVIQLTNGLQKPTSRNETNSYDWLVW